MRASWVQGKLLCLCHSPARCFYGPLYGTNAPLVLVSGWKQSHFRYPRLRMSCYGLLRSMGFDKRAWVICVFCYPLFKFSSYICIYSVGNSWGRNQAWTKRRHRQVIWSRQSICCCMLHCRRWTNTWRTDPQRFETVILLSVLKQCILRSLIWLGILVTDKIYIYRVYETVKFMHSYMHHNFRLLTYLYTRAM